MSLSLPPDQLNALWNEFLERWPLERLSDMQLSDYTGVGNDDSFCYWLESRTNDLGSIWGGSSFKFGVFRRKDKTHKESRLGRSYTSDFAWLNKYGNTPDEAFSSVLVNRHQFSRHFSAVLGDAFHTLPVTTAH